MLHGSCSPRNSLKTFQDLGLLMMQHHGAAHNLLVHRLLQEVVDPFLVSNSPHRWSVARRRWSFAQGSSSTTVSQGPLVLHVAQGARADCGQPQCVLERTNIHEAVSAESSVTQKKQRNNKHQLQDNIYINAYKRRTLSHCPCTTSRSRSRSDAHVEGTKCECPAVSRCPTDGSARRWLRQLRSQNGRPSSESPGRCAWLLGLYITWVYITCTHKQTCENETVGIL